MAAIERLRLLLICKRKSNFSCCLRNSLQKAKLPCFVNSTHAYLFLFNCNLLLLAAYEDFCHL